MHADNPTAYAAFLEYKDFHVLLWEQLATRYKSNPQVACYSPVNEPCDVRLPAFYARLEKAIRAVDPEHIFGWMGILSPWNLRGLRICY